MLTDLKVGKYWGEMGVDYWDAATWKREQEENEVGDYYTILFYVLVEKLFQAPMSFMPFRSYSSEEAYISVYFIQVLVMTPQILLDALRHSFFKLDMIKVLIFDECHHARGKHPYACIMTVSYIHFYGKLSRYRKSSF